jgi:pectate lyase-like protein
VRSWTHFFVAGRGRVLQPAPPSPFGHGSRKVHKNSMPSGFNIRRDLISSAHSLLHITFILFRKPTYQTPSQVDGIHQSLHLLHHKNQPHFKMKVATILLAAAAGVSAVTTTLPKSAGVTSLPTAIPVKANARYDGKMKRFERSPSTCQEQKETGEKDASFILEDGATLSNVIIGASSGEGVHCRGKW